MGNEQDSWYSLTHNRDGSVRESMTCRSDIVIRSSGALARRMPDPLDDETYTEYLGREQKKLDNFCALSCPTGLRGRCMAEQKGVEYVIEKYSQRQK